ncbi:ABC transporter ATP-binding protein [Ferruginivarius sediminum]|uniref:ABC transporter ATP-binding protein n=1 Tax=Ferruginivarius sediminum TaxID=2661937 RepID=A0A369TB28_9PROT|nr:ABC transporter ATP-binding protein [Ferruginivarius sediminum]RDD62062.1 ABC transporter ATP-binding protein [Ferruginivarius sediminum]
MNEPVIRLDRIAKRYRRVRAVEDVSLSIHRGECVALVGHNGAGKTTLFKLMLGLAAPTAGDISVLGARPQSGDGARKRGAVGFLPENVAFDPGMTGRETLSFYAALRGCGTAGIDGLIRRVGLEDAADRRVRTYSKGMRQRLGLAQALLGAPELLLLDEPTTGLDPIVRATFYDIVAELQGQGVTVLISSHVLSELEARTDRIVILHHGHVAADGPLDFIRREAGIPTLLRIRTRPCRTGEVVSAFDGRVDWERVDERTVLLFCPPMEKMAALRRVAGMGDIVEDIETIPPGLEQLYRHYTGKTVEERA